MNRQPKTEDENNMIATPIEIDTNDVQTLWQQAEIALRNQISEGEFNDRFEGVHV